GQPVDAVPATEWRPRDLEGRVDRVGEGARAWLVAALVGRAGVFEGLRNAEGARRDARDACQLGREGDGAGESFVLAALVGGLAGPQAAAGLEVCDVEGRVRVGRGIDALEGAEAGAVAGAVGVGSAALQRHAVAGVR